MREIKFRGKAVMTKDELDYQSIPNYKGWIKGSLVVDGNDHYIVGEIVDASDDGLIHEWWAKVEPKSVGQYTGLKDKNSREIYEGDVLNHITHDFHLEVSWQALWPGFYYQYIGTEQFHKLTVGAVGHFEIIGNIYENPELLEEGKHE